MTPTLPDALTFVEELLIERRRCLQDYDVTDVESLRAIDPCHPPMPPVLLLARTPPEDLHGRLRNALLLGGPLQIKAILLGDWPGGDTITVQADGRTATGRLATLDAPTTMQLLAVLHEAHTGEPPTTTPAEPRDPAEDRARDATAPDQPTAHAGTAAAPDVNADDADTAAQATAAPAAEGAGSRPDGPPGTVARLVRIRLLGPPAIYDRDGNPVTGLRHHARELLVYLSVHRGGADLPDIMEAIWPTATVRRAAQRLSTEVADLRRRIRQAAGDPDIQPVVNTGGRYHLNPTIVHIDVWQFSDALDRAKNANPDRQAVLLRQAIEVHTGTFAQGFDYDWIEPSREQLRRCGIRSRLDLADLIAHHQPAAAATLIHAAAALDPINENLARRAMRALAAADDRAGIRAILQRLQEALHDIDEEPSEETTALAARLHRDNT